jgi:hypothetical protein
MAEKSPRMDGSQLVSVQTLVLRAYGRTVQLAGPGEIVQEARARLPSTYRSAQAAAERSWTVHKSGPDWQVLVDGEDVSTHAGSLWAIEAMLSDLELWVAERARGRVFVHAGCAVQDGRAIVLPGYSLSGKTHLTRALVRAGATYYSDEFAVVDRNGRVRPYPRPPGLRSNIWDVPQRIALEDLGGPIGRDPARVGVVAVLRYDPANEWAVAPLTRVKAILELMAHTVPARYAPRRSLHALEQATAQATAIKGTRGDADEAAARLLELLSAQAP